MTEKKEKKICFVISPIGEDREEGLGSLTSGGQFPSFFRGQVVRFC